MFENIKAIFFDFDDTLQSRAGAYRLYCDDFLTRYFPQVQGEEKERRKDEMEAHVDGGYKSREEYWPEMIELWQWEDAPDLQTLVDDFNTNFGKKVVMLEGSVETLKALKQRGYMLGMVTNGNSLLQNTKLDTAGIRDLFDMAVVSDDIGIWKPDKGIFEYAMRTLGVTPEQSLFVGDHPLNDIQGALGAGMHAVWVDYGSFAGQATPGVTAVKNVSEILNLLKETN
ncbi:MAG: HAD family hydrolase [Clostridia bacterium]|nr:HAD family hydrolase [Clostridia bacterium]